MNPVRFVLLLVLAGFSLLYVLSPGNPRRAFTFLRYACLGMIAFVMITPFLWLVSAAFKDSSVFSEYAFFPPPAKWSSATINLNNFRELLFPPSGSSKIAFHVYFINSLFISSTATILVVLTSSMAGYALSKLRFRGSKGIMVYMLGTMMIPGMLLMAPNYELIVKLGFIDSYLALLVPGAVSVFGILLYRQAMLSIPTDIIEAGRIDGCGELRIYWSLIMPLVKPITAAQTLMTFLASWNSFIAPNIFLRSQSKLTLPVILNQYIGQYSAEYGVFLSGTLLAIIPPAILFFALQKEFISGLTAGAVKE